LVEVVRSQAAWTAGSCAWIPAATRAPTAKMGDAPSAHVDCGPSAFGSGPLGAHDAGILGGAINAIGGDSGGGALGVSVGGLLDACSGSLGSGAGFFGVGGAGSSCGAAKNGLFHNERATGSEEDEIESGKKRNRGQWHSIALCSTSN
jgi:hypothetical protein